MAQCLVEAGESRLTLPQRNEGNCLVGQGGYERRMATQDLIKKPHRLLRAPGPQGRNGFVKPALRRITRTTCSRHFAANPGQGK